jgi:uncharacterized protein (TIGR03067 family)
VSVRFHHLFTIALVSSVTLATEPRDQVKDEIAKLQGTWKLVAAEAAGRPLPKEILEKLVSMVIQGDAFTETFKGKENDPDRAKIRVDPSKSPKEIDFADAEPEAGKEPNVHLGIYEIDGDTLKICISRPGMPRPKKFQAPDLNTLLRVYKRRQDVPF